MNEFWTTLTTFDWAFWVPTVIVGFLGLYVGLCIVRVLHRIHETRKLTHLRITLPRNDSKLDNEKRTEKDFHEQIGKAQQFFRSLHETRDLNLYNVFFKRMLWKKPHLSFELQFSDQELHFVIVCDPYYQNIIQKAVTSFYESAEIEILKPEDRFEIKPKGNHANGYFFFTQKSYWFPIQTYKNIEEDSLNTVANAFSKLAPEERGVVQIIAHPISNKWQKKANKKGTAMFKGKKEWGIHIPIIGPIVSLIWLPFKVLIGGYDPQTDSLSNAPGSGGGDSYVRMLQTDEEIAKQIGEKSNTSGFKTNIRVFASSPNRSRVREILDGMFVAFNAFQARGMNRFQNRRIIPFNILNAPLMRFNFRHRLPAFLERSSLLSEEELATMYHFPDARYNTIPTIKWLQYKVLAPPINLPEEGIVLGKAVYRGVEKMVHFKKEDRTRHQYVIGKSGSGKSVLLWNQAIQDIANGEGVCVIDPHGDLIEDVLACVPKERAKDVVVFDPSDRERPMGLNLLEANTTEEQDRASLDAMEIFIKLFGNEIFGPRIQHYFRNGCLTLMSDKEEGATLIDIPRLFIDEDFQRYKVSKVTNPVVKSFWENEMAQTGDREKQEMIPYFTSKFGPFVTNTTMRNIIGQTKSAFNIREVMDNKKILLINLAKGKIGGVNAQLLGLIIVAKINMAAMARADMPAKDRKDFYLYVDEFQNFATDTFASILSEARKYRLNLIMAHQYIAQLSEAASGIAIGQKDTRIRDAVFGNVGTIVSFKVGAEDAEYLEKEYAPLLSQQDILSIANYKTYLKLNIDNTTSRPFSMETLYDPDLKNDKINAIIKKYSRMKYGRKKEFVDAEIEARMGIDNLSQINEAAKADPTVPDVLLTEKAVDTVKDTTPQAGGLVQQLPGTAKPAAPSAEVQKAMQTVTPVPSAPGAVNTSPATAPQPKIQVQTKEVAPAATPVAKTEAPPVQKQAAPVDQTTAEQ